MLSGLYDKIYHLFYIYEVTFFLNFFPILYFIMIIVVLFLFTIVFYETLFDIGDNIFQESHRGWSTPYNYGEGHWPDPPSSGVSSGIKSYDGTFRQPSMCPHVELLLIYLQLQQMLLLSLLLLQQKIAIFLLIFSWVVFQLQFLKLMLLPSSVLKFWSKTMMRWSKLGGFLSHTKASVLVLKEQPPKKAWFLFNILTQY